MMKVIRQCVKDEYFMQYHGDIAALKNVTYFDKTNDSLDNWKTWKILTNNTMVI